MFPETPRTLLRKIAELARGDDAAEWQAFVELYTPPLTHFIRTVNGGLSPMDVEETVQDVFVRLVEVLRAGRIEREKGRFRDYLALMTRRILIDRYRAAFARPDRPIGAPPADGGNPEPGTDPANGMFPAVSDMGVDPGAVFDLKWRLAVRAAATEHVLTKTAVSPQSVAIYRALEGLSSGFEGLSPKEIAARFGVSYDTVKQIRSRINRAITAIENRFR